jgi:hypothetical protein
MSNEIPQFSGLTLSKIGDRGVQVTEADKSPPPPIDPKEHDIEEAEQKRPPGR